MIQFLEIDEARDVELIYINCGDTIEGRIYVHYKTGGCWGFSQQFPRSCLEINQLNQILFEQEAFTAVKHYFDTKNKTIPIHSIVRVLPHASSLADCLGVVALYNGDDTYMVVFQNNITLNLGIHYIEHVDPLNFPQCTWDVTGKYSEAGLRLLERLSK